MRFVKNEATDPGDGCRSERRVREVPQANDALCIPDDGGGHRAVGAALRSDRAALPDGRNWTTSLSLRPAFSRCHGCALTAQAAACSAWLRGLATIALKELTTAMIRIDAFLGGRIPREVMPQTFS